MVWTLDLSPVRTTHSSGPLERVVRTGAHLSGPFSS